MTEIRKVRLRQCSECEGFIYRAIISDRMAWGDGGNEVDCTYVEDCCDGCKRVCQKTVTVAMPLVSQLHPMFDKWVRGEFASVDAFDEAVGKVFVRFGGGWETQAS